MSYNEQGLRVFGVSLLAMFGLTAFLAGGAQATVGAKWLVLGSTFAGTKKISAELDTSTVLDLIGGTFNITLHCTTVKSEDILIFGEGEGTGKVAFSGCTASQGGMALPKCDPINQPIVASFKVLLILHNSETYVLFSPPAGETKFAVVKFGEECSLAPSKEVTGTLVAECGHLNAGVFVHLSCSLEETSHLLQQAPRELFATDEIQFAKKPSSLDGIGKVFLTVEPSEKWGGIG